MKKKIYLAMVTVSLITVIIVLKVGPRFIGTQSTSQSNTIETPDDGDGVTANIEDQAFHHGDGNDDGVLDKEQASVVSAISPLMGKPFTLVMTGGDCQAIREFKVLTEKDIKNRDKNYSYPLGLFSFNLLCSRTGKTATATYYFEQAKDKNWIWRQYSDATKEYTELEKTQNNSTQIDGTAIKTVSYEMKEGGQGDSDELANATITVLAGPAVKKNNTWIYIVLALIFIPLLVWIVRKHKNYKGLRFIFNALKRYHTRVINWTYWSSVKEKVLMVKRLLSDRGYLKNRWVFLFFGIANTVTLLIQLIYSPNIFNYFSFFTILCNILATMVFFFLGTRGRRRRVSPHIEFFFGAVVTYMTLVGVVYWTLLRGMFRV